MTYSLVIPLYNRPQEIEELLYSLTKQNYKNGFEVVVVEDGSDSEFTATEIAERYKNQLDLKYFQTDNNGAGMARNYGMSKASGDYFIILDSDVLVPVNYLNEVDEALKTNYTDVFGGADAAHISFTPLQKAIDFSMTSFFTTGGIRGSKKSVDKFQPRSFNMGISKKAFEVTKGFSKMKVGEDIDFSFRCWENGLETQYIDRAFVFHKRRNSLDSFLNQTYEFGKARPFLNKKYPGTAKITYWFPTLFILGFVAASVLFLFGKSQFILLYYLYFMLLFMSSLWKYKDVKVAFLSIITTLIQMTGYGFGFLKSVLIK